MTIACLLCGTQAALCLVDSKNKKRYFACPNCRLRFLDPPDRLSRPDEEAHYRLHENNVDDPRYRAFVAPLYEAILAHVPAGAHGLDFGAGDGPVLGAMLREVGYDVVPYDPIFCPHEDRLTKTYDFVFACEVVEHFHDPAREFRRLAGLLRSGGTLAFMTQFQAKDLDFETWYYQRDPTHVVFYAVETVTCLSAALGLSLRYCDGKKIAILSR